MTQAYIGLCSTVGDSPGHIREGLDRLSEIGSLERNSDLYRVRQPHDARRPDAYSAVAQLKTGRDIGELPGALLALQRQEASDTQADGIPSGRELDLLLLGGGPSVRDRPCVLVPLASIAPRLAIPPDGATAAELVHALPQEVRTGIERIAGTAQLSAPRDLDYDTIGEPGANYRALRPLSRFDVELFDEVARATGLGPGMSVLDVGCGTGRFSALLAQRGASVTGLDRSANMLAAARADRAARPGTVEYLEGDANAGFPAGPYDAIVFFFSVHYMSLRPDFWRRLRGSLKRDGVVAFATFPHRHFIETEHARFFPSIPRIDMARFPSSPRLIRLLRENGFSGIGSREVIAEEEGQADDLIARTQRRYLSTFHLISETEFERGLAAMRAAYAHASTVRRSIRAVVVSARVHESAP